MPPNDHDLLQRYARRAPDAESAFAELVDRHLNLVYSVARRLVGSSHAAEDVTQAVFIDLARHAATLPPETPVLAWLHLVARRTAIDTIRRESRRQARETAAVLDEMKTSPAPWSAIEPLVDEAVESLPPVDRTAILLRFFENKSLREVGAALGTSDDAAQKRIARALDQLRAFFGRRGVAVTALALTSDLSAHAIHPAPATLASTIFTSLPVGLPLTSAASTPFLSHALVAAAVVGVLGFAAYEAAAVVEQRHELAEIRLHLTEQRLTLGRLGTASEAAAQRTREARTQIAGFAQLSAVDPDVEAAITAWLERLEYLKALADERPEFGIPELAVLTDEEWFAAARYTNFDSEADTRETFRTVHASARAALARAFARAITVHADAHDGLLPPTATHLAPLLPPQLPPALFTRFEMLRTGRIDAVPPDEWLLAERPAAAQERGNRIYVSRKKPSSKNHEPRTPLVLSLALLLLAASVVVDRQYLAPLRRETETLRAELARLEATVRRTRHRLTQTERENAELERQAATTRADTAAAEAASSMKLWAGRITLLKRLLEEMPSESIPELRLLSATDWIQHIRTRELDTPADIRTALATLRAAARRKFAGVLQEALGRFIAQSKGELPSDIRHLAVYLTPPADLEMLQRYSLLRTGRSGDAREYIIRESAPGDMILSIGLETVHYNISTDGRPSGDENEAAIGLRALAAIDAVLTDSESNPEKWPLTLFALKEFIEKLDPQLDTAFEGDFNTELKRAVKRFTADRAGAIPAHFADVLPFLSRRDQFAVIVRPLFAELDYMRDHHGQRPTDPAQLGRYLERPLDQIKLLHDFKLIVKGDDVSINLDISAHSSDGPSP